MAIKGKSKARTKKAVTRGPKPAYVPVRKPLFARRGVQIGLALVVVLGSAAGIWYGVAKERSRQRAEDLAARERAAVSKYQIALDPVLQGIGEVVPPSGFKLRPDLEATIADLEKGNVTVKEATKTAKATAEAAKRASKAVEAIDVLGLVQGKGFGFKLVNALLTSKSQILDGLRLYEQAALILAQATEAPGDQRDQLAARATGVGQIASKILADGYSDYVDAQIMVKIFVPTGLAPAPLP